MKARVKRPNGSRIRTSVFMNINLIYFAISTVHSSHCTRIMPVKKFAACVTLFPEDRCAVVLANVALPFYTSSPFAQSSSNSPFRDAADRLSVIVGKYGSS